MELENKIADLMKTGQRSVDVEDDYNHAIVQLNQLTSRIRSDDFNLLQLPNATPLVSQYKLTRK